MTGIIDRPEGLAGGRFQRRKDDGRLQILEQQLAELRATRTKLTRDLDTLRSRNAQLEASLAQGVADPLGAHELSELRALTERQEQDLESARARIVYLQGRITEERERATQIEVDPPAAAEPATPPATDAVPRRGRLRRLAPLGLVALAAGGAGAGAMALAAGPGATETQTRVVERAVPPCAPGAATGTCSTGAVLTIVEGAKPLLLPEVQARVLSAEWTPASVNVRLRMRNVTTSGERIGGADRPVYLSVAGRRLYPDGPTRVLLPDQGTNVELRFPLDPAARKVLTRSGGRADLGLVPFSTARSGDAPRRIGVIRLSL